MVATVKSRSVIAGVTPSGSVIAEIWIESPMSVPVRSTSIDSGIDSAGQFSSTSWRTIFRIPPRLMPGDSSSFTKFTGTSTAIVAPLPRRRKSTWVTKSLTGSSCTSRGITRWVLPSTSRSSRELMNVPLFQSFVTSLCESEIRSGDFLSP